ncbi:GlcNAc-PI de-N-acetylase family [mine drainage metagenome]|uniref:GlcNAc-PI de-N-acetylase family n=1 Tax=mine drainage metagenome TaxID=410659 RepID=T1A776_9ZZZZ
MHSRDSSGVNVLLLLAHNDDEYFSSLRIREELQSGNRVRVIYFTHGSIYGTDSETRIAESTRVLISMGIQAEDIFMLGYECDIFDGQLSKRIADGYENLCAHIPEKVPIERVYAMAWEGGHPDHDACHMIGVAFARARSIRHQLYEFPAYHASQRQLKSSGVMQFANGNVDTWSTASGRIDAFCAFCLACRYPSQFSTFLALLPGSAMQLLLRGYQVYRLVPESRDYTQPPHSGMLLYEKRFHFSFNNFLENAKAFQKYM